MPGSGAHPLRARLFSRSPSATAIVAAGRRCRGSIGRDILVERANFLPEHHRETVNNAGNKSLESWIWDAACSIRGAQEAPKFKDFILPLGEQRKIAAVLSAVQRAIERQERLIALSSELKKALMHKLFAEGTRGEKRKQMLSGSDGNCEGAESQPNLYGVSGASSTIAHLPAAQLKSLTLPVPPLRKPRDVGANGEDVVLMHAVRHLSIPDESSA